MRIVVLTPEYPPAPRLGGIGTNAAALAPALAAMGHDVIVITPTSDAPTADAVRSGHVRVIQVNAPEVPGATPFKAVLDRLALRVAIARKCKALQPDVVHTAEWEALGWLVARSRRSVVTRLATPTYLVDEMNGTGGDPATRMLTWWERDQTRRSRVVYAPTGAIVDRVAADWGLDPRQLRVIPNPVDVGRIQLAGAADPPFPVGEHNIVFIGRIERRKGIDTLARALELVLDQRPHATAVIIGRALEEQAELDVAVHQRLDRFGDRVRFAGELPTGPAMAIVGRAAVVALPSEWESFGYVCVEAMALGRAVVASNAGGFADLIDHGRTGWLVPVGDDRALATALVGCLDDPARSASVGAAARARADDFSVDVITPQVEAILQMAVAPGVRRLDRSIFTTGYRRHFRPDDTDPFAALYARKRDAVVANVNARGPGRVLDVGGGYGRVSGLIAERHDVVLCDLSAEMLSEAATRVSRSVAIVRANALVLPFADATFDGLVALDLLVHLDDLVTAMSELRRVVRPGGWLLVDSTNARAAWMLAYPAYVEWRPRRFVQTFRAGGVLPEWADIVHHQRPGEVGDAAAACRLRLEAVTPFGPRWSPKWQVWEFSRV